MAESQSLSSPAISDPQYPLLATKLFIPQPLPNIVPRPNLTERLADGMGAALTLVSAPAGFGKTTLLGEWINNSETPVAWISLDEGDNDPVRFLTYLIAALQNIGPDIGRDALATLKSPQAPPIELVLTSLINEISAIPDDFVLALDDYHLVDTQQIHDIVEFLLDHLPRQIHLVIASRADPPLPLAFLRSRNQISEFRAADLNFTTDETTEFFNRVMTLGLSTGDIALLESRTEGWIAGMQLAGLSMQSCEDLPSFIKTFTGDDRHIVDYLAEQVLNLQTEKTRNFLLHTSILKRLSEPLCDFVTGQTGSQEILNHLERANLFIVPLDNKRHWYRYHHLFGDLLQQRLRQTQGHLVLEIHSRASRWYEENQLNDEAVDHALAAQDFERAANLMGQYLDSLLQIGIQTKLLSWLEVLPDEHISSRPFLGSSYAWILASKGQTDMAEQRLQVVEQAMESITAGVTSDDREEVSPHDIKELKARTFLIRASISYQSGNIPGMIRYSRLAFENISDDNQILRVVTAIFLGSAHYMNGNAILASQSFTEAATIYELDGSSDLILTAKLRAAVSQRLQGHLNQTMNICQELLPILDRIGMTQTTTAGWIYTILGEVFCDWNELDKAADYVGQGIKWSEQVYHAAIHAMSNIVLTRVLFAKRDFAAAEVIIKETREIARKSAVEPWTLGQLAAWEVRIWLARGNLDDAAKWVQECGFKIDDKLTFLQEAEYIVFARILVARGQFGDALLLLGRLIEDAEVGGRVTSQLEMMLIQAVAQKANGKANEAVAILEKVLVIAEPEGFIRIFIDEGPPMAELLEQMLDTEMDFPRQYVKKLLTAYKVSSVSKPDGGLLSPLSDRELEVLRLIAAGLTNKEITQLLFISMNTVKTHVRNTIGKLGVDNRTKAVAKAKEIGLL